MTSSITRPKWTRSIIWPYYRIRILLSTHTNKRGTILCCHTATLL